MAYADVPLMPWVDIWRNHLAGRGVGTWAALQEGRTPKPRRNAMYWGGGIVGLVLLILLILLLTGNL